MPLNRLGRGRRIGVVVLLLALVAIVTTATLWIVLRRDATGPLVGKSGESVSIFAPPGQEWWSGTYGLILCSDTGAEVEITSVDYRYRVDPKATHSVIGQVPGGFDSGGDGQDREAAASFQGTIAQFARRYPSARLEPARGARLDAGCSTDHAAAVTELLTTMDVERQGGWIDRVTIHYTSNGQPDELSVDVNYVACGSAILDRDFYPAGSG